MITDNHRQIANLAANALHLGEHRRATLLHALAQRWPRLVLLDKQRKIDAEKLRATRKQLRWSQAKLAKKAELSLRQYQNIETGHTGTTRKRIYALAKALKIDADEITR